MFASAHDFPKFVTVGAAMEHELRKVGTRPDFPSLNFVDASLAGPGDFIHHLPNAARLFRPVMCCSSRFRTPSARNQSGAALLFEDSK
jgi:hypothetical protein